MARRDHPLNDLFEIAAMLPWWVGVVLAVLAYVGLHSIASTPVVPPANSSGMGDFAAKTIYVTAAKYGQWILPIPLLLGAAASAYARWKRVRLYDHVGAAGEQPVLNDLSWQEFEMLVGEAFRRRGFSVLETGGAGADGGVDLVLARGAEKFLVQCKQWKALKVGVTTVRELYGVIAAKGATGGFVVTSGEFTKDATEFARGRNIELIDGPKLKTMLRGAGRDSEPLQGVQPQSVPRASDAKNRQSVSAPTCPRCGGTMVKRIAKQGASAGKPFWGCTEFPKCRGTRPIE